MRHQKTQRKLGVWSSYRKMMLRNLVTNLVMSGKIKTTEARAKELRRQLDKIFQTARKDDLSSKRRVYSYFTTREAAKRCLDDVKEKFDDRTGGFAKIYKLDQRRGDGASMVLVKLDYA